MREAAARALEHRAAFHDAGDASPCSGRRAPFARRRARPGLAVHAFDGVDDAGLQADEVWRTWVLKSVMSACVRLGEGTCSVAHTTARCPMSRRYCAPSKWIWRATS
jgi:hypothetical protein